MAIENFRVGQGHEYPVPPDTDDEGEEDAPRHALDTEEAHRKKRRLLEWYNQEREKQAINRYQQAVDDDYYDGLQWSDEDAEELKRRGQAPLVFNEIKPVCDWIIGTERRARIDYKVLPREKGDVTMAVVKGKVIRYINDVNLAHFKRSHAFGEAVRAGVGWLEEGVRTDPEEELIYVRAESWRNIIYDSNAMELDLSDARYMFRWRWTDLDIAQAAFPDRAEELRRSSVSSELFGPEQDEELWYLGTRLQERDPAGNVLGRRTYISDASYVNNRRERVRLIEAWYREPTNKRFIQGRNGIVVPYDPADPDQQWSARNGASVFDRLYLQMRVAILTEDTLILERESPYRHNKFPFTPIWAYRRKRDNAAYGVIRPSRDPQDDLNKRASKAQWILASNRVIYEKGAFDDPDEAREELARPDAFVEKAPGKEVITDNDRDVAEAHLRIMVDNAARIRQTGGVTGENLGLETNATSGKAILARQTQGTVNTTELFDNYRLAMQVSGQKVLSLIEQFYTDAKVIRITGANPKADPEFLELNQVDPATGEMVNDITATQADFIIGEQDYQQSVRMAMFETMMEMVSRMPPELAIKFLDLVFEFSDLPNKEEIVRRLRLISGMIPADDENLTPAEREQVEQMRQNQAVMQSLSQKEIAAKIEKLVAEVDKLKAQALEIMQKAAGAGVETQGKAVETAATITAMPDVAPVADEVLRSAGYQDQGGAAPGGQPTGGQ